MTKEYFKELVGQCKGGKKRYGGINSLEEFKVNFVANCIPEALLSSNQPDYDAFLEQRRKLMAMKIKAYFQTL